MVLVPLDRGLLDRGLDLDLDRGLDRGLDRDLDRDLDLRDLDRGLDLDLDRVMVRARGGRITPTPITHRIPILLIR